MIKRPIIISLGGSLIVPSEIDHGYVRKFVQTLPHGRYVIFTGGGKIARQYQAALQQINPQASAENQDWVGIKTSWLNAELVKQAFGKLANDTVITDPRIKLRWPKPIWLGAGWKPGRSTDYDAVRLAVENNITTVINLSNIDYVYTKDPRKHADAEKITQTTWKDFRKLIGSTWDPGLNVPFDPIAAKLAQQHHITVHILNGKKLDNVLKAIAGKPFVGTSIT